MTAIRNDPKTAFMFDVNTISTDGSMKLDNLYRRYRLHRSKAAYIMQVEDVLDTCWGDEDYSALFRILKVTIEGKARKFASRWYKKRLEYEDFISLFYEVTWTVSRDYYDYGGYKTDFYFYETLLLALERRAIDLTRKATSKQESVNSTALLVADFDEHRDDHKRYASRADIDQSIIRVIDSLFIDAVIDDSRLTGDERQYIEIVRADPDITQYEIAMALNFDHNEKVRRLQKRLYSKLTYWHQQYHYDAI